jgi:hypothetical protein
MDPTVFGEWKTTYIYLCCEVAARGFCGHSVKSALNCEQSRKLSHTDPFYNYKKYDSKESENLKKK